MAPHVFKNPPSDGDAHAPEHRPGWCQRTMLNHSWLVVLTILQNMKVNEKDYPIYYGTYKSCSKPPTGIGIDVII